MRRRGERPLDQLEYVKTRRDLNREATPRRCINDSPPPAPARHGEPVDGGCRCAACRETHRKGRKKS